MWCNAVLTRLGLMKRHHALQRQAFLTFPMVRHEK